MTEPALPIVLLPIGTDDAALDACLAALEQGTPAGTRVWLLDDAQAGPRGIAIIERWLDYTQLQAEYSRRPRPIGEAAHLAEVFMRVAILMSPCWRLTCARRPVGWAN